MCLFNFAKQGGNKVSLISYSGVHQLHIFIFVLAVMHVLYSVILMALGNAKVNFFYIFLFRFHFT